jgi:hypothetical protein
MKVHFAYVIKVYFPNYIELYVYSSGQIRYINEHFSKEKNIEDKCHIIDIEIKKRDYHNRTF